MKKKTYIILLLIIISNTPLVARQNTGDQIEFSGNIIPKYRTGITRVAVSYLLDDGFDIGSTIHISAKVGQNGDFQFSLPNLHKPAKVYISTNIVHAKRLISTYFFTEPGDKIKLEIFGKDSINFNGAGSEKYKLALKLQNHFWNQYFDLDLTSIKFKEIRDGGDLSSRQEQLSELLKNFENKDKKLIASSPGINSDMKEILNYEFSRYRSEWAERTIGLLTKFPNFKKKIASNYLEHRNDFSLKPSKLSVYSYRYLTDLLTNEWLEILIKNDFKTVELEQFYNAIKYKYSGLVGERLLAQCILDKLVLNHFESYTPQTIDSLLKDLSKTAKIPVIKKVVDLEIMKISKSVGTQILDGEFTTLNGEKMSIKSLRGKVVLIDTWFFGCGACATFHNIFEKDIYPQFKDNKNLVVLSINIDKKDENWRKGIISKKYSSEDYINVSTGDSVGLDHPFMKYYSVKSSPHNILIDGKGKICFQPEYSSIKEWIRQINNALDSNGKYSSK